ncbi:MAG: GIY-YIG nuclease family protein [Candidatus Omnitrophota bacterium]|nr:GIY-YIG nuclease family protein [Candidatus Omnitrophota bacterium]
MWQVYIIECKDSKLYTGVTTDIDRRLSEHNLRKGAKFTRVRAPVKLVYKQKVATRSAALKREAAIKKLPRAEKLSLILSANRI